MACLRKERKASLAGSVEGGGGVQGGVREMVRLVEPHPEENGELSKAPAEQISGQMCRLNNWVTADLYTLLSAEYHLLMCTFSMCTVQYACHQPRGTAEHRTRGSSTVRSAVRGK